MSTLSFATSIYCLEAVQAAVEAFSEWATLSLEEESLEEGKDDFVVRVSEVDESVEAIFADEFCNYALHGSIVRARE